MADTEEKLTLSIDEVCKKLGAGKSLVAKLIAAGEIPSMQLGRRRLVPADALRKFIEERTHAA
jgi:excisionase family DNA binding protein